MGLNIPNGVAGRLGKGDQPRAPGEDRSLAVVMHPHQPRGCTSSNTSVPGYGADAPSRNRIRGSGTARTLCELADGTEGNLQDQQRLEQV